MTKQDIMAMKPGPEMDALVAEKMMGVEPEIIAIASDDGGKSACAMVDRRHGPWYNEIHLKDWLTEQQKSGYHKNHKIEHWKRYKPYSTSIADAWQVVEKMQEKYFWLSLVYKSGCLVEDDLTPAWEAEFRFVNITSVSDWLKGATVGALTVPEAICKASLIAMVTE